MTLLEFISVAVIVYFAVINLVYLMLIAVSFFHIRRQQREKLVFSLTGLFNSNLYSPISILAPAYNEESTVVASVRSLLQLQFPNYEVIVINDGSKDRTMEVLIEHFKLEKVDRYVPLVLEHKPIRALYKSSLYPELLVVDKENGRKADALNAGLNVSRNDLVCSIDADSVLEPMVLQTMLRSFVEDETTIAVGGIVRIANDCVFENNEMKEVRIPKSFLARIQVVEYLRAFLFGRVGWDYLDSLLIISGAFGVFDRQAVLKVGGYLHDTVGEDMELVVRLHRYHREQKIPYRVRFLPEPVCWTEVPEDPAILAKQRNRWQRGLADTLWRHRAMMFNPRYGRLGMFAMPFFFFIEMLGPVVEVAGYIFFFLAWVFDWLNFDFFAVFLMASILLGMVLSVSSVLCEEFTYRRYPNVRHIFVMFVYSLLENFGYRQAHTWWRLMGLVDFLKGNKQWGEMTRKGFSGTAGSAQAKAAVPAAPAAKPTRSVPVSILVFWLIIAAGTAYKYRAEWWNLPPSPTTKVPPVEQVQTRQTPAATSTSTPRSLVVDAPVDRRASFGPVPPRTDSVGTFHTLALGTFISYDNAVRFRESLGHRKSASILFTDSFRDGETVFVVGLGQYEKPYFTWRLRGWYGMADSDYPDAFTRAFDAAQKR